MLISCPTCATQFRLADDALGASGRQVRCAQCRTVWFAAPGSGRPDSFAAEAVAPPPKAKATAPEKTPEPAIDDADWGAAFADEAAGKGTPARAATAEDATPVTASPPIAPTGDEAGMPKPVRSAEPVRSVESAAAKRPRSRLRDLARRPPRSSFKFSWPILAIMAGIFLLVSFLLGREQVVRTVPDSAQVYETLGLPVNLRGVEFQEVRGSTEMVDGVLVLVVEGRLVNISGKTVDLPRLRLAVRDATGKEIYTWTATAPAARLTGGEAVPFRSRLASPPPDGARVEVRFFTRMDAGGR